MRTLLHISGAFLLAVSLAHSQSDSAAGFIINPHGLHIAPFKANIEEPRIGVFKFLDAAQMKVDVGNSIDMFGYELPESDMRFTAGIDFLAYAFTTGAQGLRLQIDAVDGLFGGNLSFSKRYDLRTLEIRLRILHHSAHFVDGHFDTSTGTWIDDKAPVPYTKDFGEIVTACRVQNGSMSFRPYAGLGYATLIRPAEYERFSFLGGAEIAVSVGNLASQAINIYCAYNISVDGTPTYIATHQIQAGAKLGRFYGRGPSLYLAYYDGNHMFGEYYGERLSTFGVGFTVDFF